MVVEVVVEAELEAPEGWEEGTMAQDLVKEEVPGKPPEASRSTLRR